MSLIPYAIKSIHTTLHVTDFLEIDLCYLLFLFKAISYGVGVIAINSAISFAATEAVARITVYLKVKKMNLVCNYGFV